MVGIGRSENMGSILAKAQAIESYILDFRRSLHKEPELSGQEYKTQAKIMAELDKLGIPYRKVGNTSLIATLKGAKEGKTLVLRGDIDALPINEEADIDGDYKSTNPGVMHACGHDSHAAILLGAARILTEMKEELAGEVRFFFQEGEETSSGALKIIEAGGLEGVDVCFGLHGFAELDTGDYNMVSGYRMAGCDTIVVTFEGVSGHGSTPYVGKDTIHPACQFVIGLQGIIGKNVDPRQPAVLSVGQIKGGTRANIIAKTTEVNISMRYFDPKVREVMLTAIQRHAKAIGDAYEVKAEITVKESSPSLYNDEETARLAEQAAAKVFGPGHNQPVEKQMISEDMALYLQQVKGVYAFVG
jgi:amidohydrolase